MQASTFSIFKHNVSSLEEGIEQSLVSQNLTVLGAVQADLFKSLAEKTFGIHIEHLYSFESCLKKIFSQPSLITNTNVDFSKYLFSPSK